MAEGWLRTHGREHIAAASAGTHPSTVHPLAIRVMAEAGVDISRHRSKSVAEFIGKPLDYVITVCDTARETCPVLPGKHMTMHLPFDDPAAFVGTDEQRLSEFRRVRDLIGNAMREFAKMIRSSSVRD